MAMKPQRTIGRIFLLLLTMAWSRAAHGWNYLTPLTNAVVCPGDTVVFSTTASGPTPYKFNWYKDGAIVAGQTNNSLRLTNVSAASVGTYSVILKGGYNNVTNSATLSLKTPVSLSPLPNLVRSLGAQAVFNAVAAGTGPFTYVWQKNGAVLPGQTQSSLTLANLAATNSGTYQVTATGACGSTASSSATLTVDVCFPSVDVMLVIDRSGSMTGKPYDDARQACSNFVHNLYMTANADQAGLVSYNSSATLDQKLTNNVHSLEQAIGSIPAAGGYTSISLGLQTAQGELVAVRHNPSALPVLLLLSDGLPTASDTKSNALYNATQAKNAGTRIFTVGLGNVDPVLLANMASSPGDYYYTTNSGDLAALFDAISAIICRPPTNIVVMGPTNVTLCQGLTANFSVTATGCDPFTYQWSKDGVKLTGQTNASLVIPNVSATSAGVYAIVVTGQCRAVTNSAVLTVNAPVLITSGVMSQTNCPGDATAFSIAATGTSLSYQWFKGTSPLSGETNSTFGLSNLSQADAGTYMVVVNGTCGTSVTNTAVLGVNTPVSITAPPGNQTAVAGSKVGFSVGATGTGLNYQWYFNGAALWGQTNSSLSLSGVTTNNAGSYCVVVGGACGTPQTNCVTLTVNTPVTVTTPPMNQTNCPGTTAVFSETATGTALTYQWYFNGGLLSGQTNSQLLLPNVNSGNAGSYCVVVGGAAGGPLTNCATLTVNTSVTVITPPANSTNCPGSTVVFNVAATGTSLNYQWCKSTGALIGQTNSSLTLTGVGASDAGTYSVIISGACSSVTNSVSLTVNQNTSVAPLASTIQNIGGSASFTAAASGTGPFSYVWKKNGAVLPAATTSLLTLTNLQPDDGGTYTVEVTGACGNAAATSAALTINLPPTVAITYPTNNAVFVVPAMFTVLAGASDPDGVVTNVEFFQSTNNVDFVKIGETNVAPYFLIVTNAVTNRYTFLARATDNLGATGTSAPVSVSLIDRPPLTLLGGVTFNPQSGLFHLTNVVFNPTYSIFDAVRVYIYGISNPIVVANATGITNGIPYVQSAGPILPGSAWTNTIKFFVPLGAVTPNPKLVTELVMPTTPIATVTNGTGLHIARGSMLRDRTFMVEFVTATNRQYYLQFSRDLKNWTTVQPPIPGNGTTIQWIDAGPPETESLPVLANQRFYKVISAP